MAGMLCDSTIQDVTDILREEITTQYIIICQQVKNIQ